MSRTTHKQVAWRRRLGLTVIAAACVVLFTQSALADPTAVTTRSSPAPHRCRDRSSTLESRRRR